MEGNASLNRDHVGMNILTLLSLPFASPNFPLLYFFFFLVGFVISHGPDSSKKAKTATVCCRSSGLDTARTEARQSGPNADGA
jgi:hypothetical protein